MKFLPYTRADRIKKLIHREAAKIISSLKDPRAGEVTVTWVDISSDLRHAKIYFSISNKTHLNQAKDMFTSAKGYIRSQIAAKLGLKHAVDVEFVYDNFLEQSSRVLFLLDKIKEENEEGL